MTTRIDHYPLASQVVDLSLATELSEGAVSKITVWLKARAALTPTAIAYFVANGLLSEVLSKAGLDEETTYSTLTQTATSTEGGYYLYTLLLTLPSS